MPKPLKSVKPQPLSAEFQRSSFNAESRTIDVVCTTDAPVVRWGWDGQYNEVLSMEKKHIRMDRFNSGAAPLLNSHNRYSLEDVIGVIEKAWIEGNKLMATVRFSDRESVKEIVQDVANGILKSLSIGYKILKVEETKAESGQLPTLKATDWEPFEVSFVPVPADFNAQVRSNQVQEYVVEWISERGEENENNSNHNNSDTMTEEEKRAAEAAEQKRIKDAAIAAQTAERARIKGIRDAVKTFDLSDELAERLIEEGKTLDESRAEIQVEFAKKDPNKGANNRISVTGQDEKEIHREAMIAGLVMRSGEVPIDKLSEKEKELGRKFVEHSLLDLAKERMEAAGENIKGLSSVEIAKRSITSSTSDFPVLLEGTNRRVLLANYTNTPDTWRRFCATGSVNNFLENKRLRMGSFSELDELGEGSEYKNKEISDADYEKVSAKTKGNLINISRQMIINDDLGGFTRLASMLGRAAARSIEIDVYKLLEANPALVDGVALFHATHGNFIDTGGTGLGTPTVTNIDTMRQLMAKQKDKDNNDYLDIRPSIIVVPTKLGGAAKIVNGSQYDPDATNKLQKPNIVFGLFSEVVDTPRLVGDVYYMFADPSVEPVIEVSFLNGVQTPYMESMETFDVDGLKWKVRMDYGVSAVGFRGAVKNKGA